MRTVLLLSTPGATAKAQKILCSAHLPSQGPHLKRRSQYLEYGGAILNHKEPPGLLLKGGVQDLWYR